MYNEFSVFESLEKDHFNISFSVEKQETKSSYVEPLKDTCLETEIKTKCSLKVFNTQNIDIYTQEELVVEDYLFCGHGFKQTTLFNLLADSCPSCGTKISGNNVSIELLEYFNLLNTYNSKINMLKNELRVNLFDRRINIHGVIPRRIEDYYELDIAELQDMYQKSNIENFDIDRLNEESTIILSKILNLRKIHGHKIDN